MRDVSVMMMSVVIVTKIVTVDTGPALVLQTVRDTENAEIETIGEEVTTTAIVKKIQTGENS